MADSNKPPVQIAMMTVDKDNMSQLERDSIIKEWVQLCGSKEKVLEL